MTRTSTQSTALQALFAAHLAVACSPGTTPETAGSPDAGVSSDVEVDMDVRNESGNGCFEDLGPGASCSSVSDTGSDEPDWVDEPQDEPTPPSLAFDVERLSADGSGAVRFTLPFPDGVMRSTDGLRFTIDGVEVAATAHVVGFHRMAGASKAQDHFVSSVQIELEVPPNAGSPIPVLASIVDDETLRPGVRSSPATYLTASEPVDVTAPVTTRTIVKTGDSEFALSEGPIQQRVL